MKENIILKSNTVSLLDRSYWLLSPILWVICSLSLMERLVKMIYRFACVNFIKIKPYFTEIFCVIIFIKLDMFYMEVWPHLSIHYTWWIQIWGLYDTEHLRTEDSQLTIHKKLNQGHHNYMYRMHHFVICQLVANTIISNMLTANSK